MNEAGDEKKETSATTIGDAAEEKEISRPRENDLTPPPAVEAGGDADQTED